MSFTITQHALDQAQKMGLEGPEIREAMLNPRFVGNTNNGREIRSRGKVSLIVTKEAPVTIVTVLWATANAWANDHETIQSRTGDRREQHMAALRRAKKMQKRSTRGRGF